MYVHKTETDINHFHVTIAIDLSSGSLTLFDKGRRGMMAPQNVFDHCPQTFRRRKLKLRDF